MYVDLITFVTVLTVTQLLSLHRFFVTSSSLVDLEGEHVQGDDLDMDSVIRADNTPHDTTPTVTIPVRGGKVYKATLVSMMNQDPHLSHER